MAYRLFYNKKVIGDVLLLMIDPEKTTTKQIKKGDVVACYSDSTLVGVNIFNFSVYQKIATCGMIAAPSSELLLVVNKLLVGASLPAMAPVTNSGYLVANITKLEEHPIDEKAFIVTLQVGEKVLTTVSALPGLAIDKKVVILLDGAIARDGTLFHRFVSRNIPSDCVICAASDLGISDESMAKRISTLSTGDDYFLGGK